MENAVNQSAEHFVNLLQFINMESHRVLDSWGDEKSIRFMQELESSKREIEKLSRSMIEFSQYIKRLADRVDDYSYQN